MTKRKQSKLSTKILLGLVAAGMTFGVMGTAQAEMTGTGTAEDPRVIIGTGDSDTVFHNQIPIAPTYVYGDIKDNTQTYSGASVAYAGGAYLQVYIDPVAEKVVTPEVTFVGEISGNSVNVKTFRAEGGAIFSKGANSTFIDTPITNNKAISGDFAHGGAIATHYNGDSMNVEYNGKTQTYKFTVPATVTFKVTENKNIAYTGNDIVVPDADYNNFDDYLDIAVAPSGGGFLSVYARDTATFDVANGGTLTIGNETPATATEDSISSAIVVDGKDASDPAIVKTGEGTLTINSNLNRYYGTYTQEAGTVNLNQDLNIDNKYDIKSGTLNMKNVTLDDRYDKLAAENIARPETVTKSDDGETLNLAIHFDWFNSNYTHTIVNSKGSLVTAAGTTVNAGAVTVNDGASINAAGALNLGSLTVNEGKVVASGATNVTGDINVTGDEGYFEANNLTLGGNITVADKGEAYIGGDNLKLTKVSTDADSNLHLTGGTLTAAKLADSITGGGKLLLEGTGILATTADQVFTYTNTVASDTDLESEAAQANAVSEDAQALVGFKAGTLSLANDYTLGYLKNAKAALGKVEATGPADLSKTSLVMTGELKTVTDTGEVETETSISVADAKDIGGDVALDKVTATSDADVTIGEDSTGLNVGALALEGEADAVSVEGKTLTLGGTETTDVITADAGTPTVALTSGATLNVGNDAVTADQKLNVGADLTADGSTINTNGQTTVTGTVALANNSTLAAKTGTLTLDKGLTTSGTSTVTGTVATTAIKTADSTTATAADTTVKVGGDTATAAVTTDGIDLTTSDGVGTVAVQSGSALTVAAAQTGTQEIKANLAATNGTVATNGDTTVTGNVTLADSNMTTQSGDTTVTGNVTLADSNVAAQSGALNVTGNIEATEGESTITGEVNVEGEIIGGGEGTVLNLGNATTAAKVTAETLGGDGGVISFDPDWTGGGQTDGTEGTIGALDYTKSGATIRIGNNTTVTIGSTDKTLAEKAFTNSGLTWSDQDILSALYIPTTLALTNDDRTSAYSLNIGSDSTKDQVLAGGTLQMTKNSLLMVEGSQVSGDQAAAITNVVATNITSDAKIYVNEAAVGTTYNILAAAEAVDGGAAAGNVEEGNSAYADAGAAASQVVAAKTKLIKFVGAEGNDTTKFSVTAETEKVSDAYKDQGLIAPNTADAAQASENEDTVDFVNDAANSDVNTTTASQVNAYNSQAALTELAGVQHGLYAADNLFDDSVMGHLTGLHTSDQDKDLWAHYIHSKEDIRGLGLANVGASYDATFNGVVVGSDFYTKGNATVGAAFTYVNGDFDGNSMAVHTENDADYYGLALYGRVEQGPMTYLGDISYLHGSNDLTQKNSGKTITGSTDSDAYSIGVRAERGFAAGQGTVTPFTGIRYMHLGTDAYTDSLGVRHDSDDANLWLLPLGVRYSADLKNGDWTVRPMAEAGYVWTFDDRDGTDKVGLNGAGDAFGFDIADAGSWYGRLGVEAARGNMTYGVAYQYQHGTSVKSNTFGVKVGYRF